MKLLSTWFCTVMGRLVCNWLPTGRTWRICLFAEEFTGIGREFWFWVDLCWSMSLHDLVCSRASMSFPSNRGNLCFLWQYIFIQGRQGGDWQAVGADFAIVTRLQYIVGLVKASWISINPKSASTIGKVMLMALICSDSRESANVVHCSLICVKSFYREVVDFATMPISVTACLIAKSCSTTSLREYLWSWIAFQLWIQRLSNLCCCSIFWHFILVFELILCVGVSQSICVNYVNS